MNGNSISGKEIKKDFIEIFEEVKNVVSKIEGRSRAGLMLGLQELGSSLNGFIGAYFPVASNIIVINKTPIRRIIKTKPELIKVSQPKEYLSNIKIGRDGLIVEQGFGKGLLLPQVPVEQGWNKEDFLSHTCMKAGLLADAWFEKNTKILKFKGQIFTEVKPRGEIKEKNLSVAQMILLM